jgi:lysophospholipase L1-like esterase
VRVAVCDPSCPLAPEERHYLLVLAHLCDNETGKGYSGQDRVASAMGVTVRTVRRIASRVEARLATAPTMVKVIRRPRMRPDGRGRTSDQWELLVVDQPDAGVALVDPESATNRTPEHDQPDAGDDQPDAGVRGVSTLLSTLNRSTLFGASDDAPETKPPVKSRRSRAKKAVGPRPKEWAPNDKHGERAKTLGLDLADEADSFRNWHDAKGSLFADWDAAFKQWLKIAPKFKGKGNGRRQWQPQPAGGHFDADNAKGDTSWVA